MTSLGRTLALLGGVVVAMSAAPGSRPARQALRVCADPNNLPFSDRAGRGFENRIAALVARDLGEPLEYTWFAQRRGFVRNTLRADRCDVVIGIIAGDDQLRTTAPYYRSTYVFVRRRDAGAPIRSFDDPRLRHMRIGIHVIGDDYNALPPAVALARRGLAANLVGFSIYGNYAEPSPPSRLLDAVAHGDIDVAVAWGPLAGYYARQSRVPLTLTPVATPPVRGIPFVYAIAMGVRRADSARAAVLERELVHRRAEIRAILTSYGVPLVDTNSPLEVARSTRP